MEPVMDPVRLWVAESELLRARTLNAVDSIYCWFYDSTMKRVYVYSLQNPALSGKEISTATIRDAALVARKAGYLHIRNLALEGGELYSLHLVECDRVVIENCEIGKFSGKYGILVSESNEGIIRNCTIDSGLRMRYDYEYRAVEDGIKLYSGCNFWKVYNNTVMDWGHSGIQLQSRNPKSPTAHNEIFSNTVGAPHVSYCRGFELLGPDGSCRENRIFRNIFQDLSVRNQVAGQNNLIHHNIFQDFTNVSYRKDGTAQVISFNNSEGNLCQGNEFFNNVIAGSDEPAIRVVSHSSAPLQDIRIVNNIFYRSGRASKDGMENAVGWVGLEENISRLIIQNNNFYNSGMPVNFFYRGRTYDISDFPGKNLVAGDLIDHNYGWDPEFIAADQGNFALQFSSPAIDQGIVTGSSQDFLGNPTPVGPAPDIGAFEFMGIPR